jgi:streptomycin 6-kinase
VPGGREWLERLPRLVEECADQWSLRVGRPFEPAHVSLVVRVEHDEAPAVLKLNFPEPESEREADALAFWNGRGAVRLLAHDEERRALLLERSEPGEQLWSVAEDEANAMGADVLRRLWRPIPREHGYRLLADEAERWAVELPRDWEHLGRPFERRLLEAAVAVCRELGPAQGELVVCHQDFHGRNVLQATREPWLAIDPKPVAGEREFDAASLLRDRRWELGRPDDRHRLRRRLDLLVDELALDRERTLRWAFAHALAWGVSAKKLERDMIHCARVLAALAS